MAYFPSTFYQCNNFCNLFLTTKAQHVIIMPIIGEINFSPGTWCMIILNFVPPGEQSL